MFEICTKLRNSLQNAKLQGYNSIIVEEMNQFEIQELSECGFNVKKEHSEENIYYIISE